MRQPLGSAQRKSAIILASMNRIIAVITIGLEGFKRFWYNDFIMITKTSLYHWHHYWLTPGWLVFGGKKDNLAQTKVC